MGLSLSGGGASGGGVSASAALGRLQLPTGALAANAPRWAVLSNAHTGHTTGRLSMHLIWLEAGTVVTNISFMCGSSAGASLTNSWFALYRASDMAQLGVTSDNATWATATVKTLALSSPYTVTASGYYYNGVCIVGTTMPNLIGSNASVFQVSSLAPFSTGLSTTGLTNPASAPSTAAALAGIAGWAWTWVS